MRQEQEEHQPQTQIEVKTETVVETPEVEVARRILKVRPVEQVADPVTERALQESSQQTRQEQIAKRAGDMLFTSVYGSDGANGHYAHFCTDLAALLASGIPASEALISAARGRSPLLQQICADAAQRVAVGATLAQAFAPWQNRLPDIFVPILASAEASGTQEQAVRRLAEAFRQGIQVAHKFEYSLPGLVSFTRMGTCEWMPGRVNQARKPNLFDKVKLLWPGLGEATRSLAMARWGRAFAMLWNSGVPTSSALEISARSAQNAEYTQAILRAADRT